MQCNRHPQNMLDAIWHCSDQVPKQSHDWKSEESEVLTDIQAVKHGFESAGSYSKHYIFFFHLGNQRASEKASVFSISIFSLLVSKQHIIIFIVVSFLFFFPLVIIYLLSCLSVLIFIRCEVNFIRPAPIDSEILSGQFVGPIQYRIWKHMKTALYPSTTYLIILHYFMTY